MKQRTKLSIKNKFDKKRNVKKNPEPKTNTNCVLRTPNLDFTEYFRCSNLETEKKNQISPQNIPC